MGRHWPQLRAGLVTLAIALGMIDGFPIPPPQDTLDWHREIVETIRPIQRTLLAPFRWIPRHLQIHQRWALFQGAAGERHRMLIEGVDRKGRTQVLFRAGDDSAQYEAELLYYRRVRGVWNPRRQSTTIYRWFGRWYGTRVLDARQDLVQIRIRMEVLAISDGVARSIGTYAHEMTFGRGALR